MKNEANEADGKYNTYMTDLTVHMGPVIIQPTTVMHIATKLLDSIPSSYDTVYVVCDINGKASIKSAEHQTGGDGKNAFSRILN